MTELFCSLSLWAVVGVPLTRFPLWRRHTKITLHAVSRKSNILSLTCKRYVKTCLFCSSTFPARWAFERLIERLSSVPDLHLLAPFSPKGRGCNFRPLVKELQTFGETDKLLLIDSLGRLFPVSEVLLALKLRCKAVRVNGLCQMIRLHHAGWEEAAREWAGRKGECGVSKH